MEDTVVEQISHYFYVITNQLSTIGWKVNGFAAKILQGAWIVRVEHGVSA